MSENYGFEAAMADLSSNLESLAEDIITNEVHEAVYSTVLEALPEALGESLSDFEFVLSNGTVVRPRKHMRLLNPKKTRQVLCYGGLRVHQCDLVVQTRVSDWELIATYPTKEEAKDALLKVKNAMGSGLESFEL